MTDTSAPKIVLYPDAIWNDGYALEKIRRCVTDLQRLTDAHRHILNIIEFARLNNIPIAGREKVEAVVQSRYPNSFFSGREKASFDELYNQAMEAQKELISQMNGLQQKQLLQWLRSTEQTSHIENLIL